MEQNLQTDPNRGVKLFILLGVAQIAYYISEHPDIAKKLYKPTETHKPQTNAEEEHS